MSETPGVVSQELLETIISEAKEEKMLSRKHYSLIFRTLMNRKSEVLNYTEDPIGQEMADRIAELPNVTMSYVKDIKDNKDKTVMFEGITAFKVKWNDEIYPESEQFHTPDHLLTDVNTDDVAA